VKNCNPATVQLTLAGAGPGSLAPGLLAWGTSAHADSSGGTVITETPYLPGSLSLTELTRDVQECQFIQILGSGQFGLCKGCANTGLGAAVQ